MPRRAIAELRMASLKSILPAFLVGVASGGAAMWLWPAEAEVDDEAEAAETSTANTRSSRKGALTAEERRDIARLCAEEMARVGRHDSRPVGTLPPGDFHPLPEEGSARDGHSPYDEALGLMSEAKDTGRWTRQTGMRARVLVTRMTRMEQADFKRELDRLIRERVVEPQRGAWFP